MKGAFSGRRGQHLTEIALVIGIIAVVFLAMQAYVKRGLQGKIKDLTDNMIGREQAAYQQDTSGLKINVSDTKTALTSTETGGEGAGGQKGVTLDEKTVSTYSSKSTDAPVPGS